MRVDVVRVMDLAPASRPVFAADQQFSRGSDDDWREEIRPYLADAQSGKLLKNRVHTGLKLTASF